MPKTWFVSHIKPVTCHGDIAQKARNQWTQIVNRLSAKPNSVEHRQGSIYEYCSNDPNTRPKPHLTAVQAAWQRC